MFIYVTHKEPPELSTSRRSTSPAEEDVALEKLLIVNPDCPVRIMLEYIRKRCKLAITTNFDLCDEYGALKGLFNLPTFAYAHQMFERKKVYYLVVLKQEKEGTIILPQLNHSNPRYVELHHKLKKFVLTGDTSPTMTPIPRHMGVKVSATALKKK